MPTSNEASTKRAVMPAGFVKPRVPTAIEVLLDDDDLFEHNLSKLAHRFSVKDERR